MATNGNGLVTIERLNKLLPKAFSCRFQNGKRGRSCPVGRTSHSPQRKRLQIQKASSRMLTGSRPAFPKIFARLISYSDDEDIDKSASLALNPMF